MRRLKILFILPEYYPHSGAGISTYYLQYIAALDAHVEKIKVIVGSGFVQADKKYIINGIEIEYLNHSIYKSYLKKFKKFELLPEYRQNIAAAWAMWDQTNGGDGFDIIECVDFGLGFIPWIVNHKKPVITRLHGSTGQIELYDDHVKNSLNGDLNRQAECILIRHSDKIITHSESNQGFWQKNFPEKEVDFIYPIFSTKTSSIPFKEKNNTGIVCSRIQDWKGPDILCEALKNIENNVLINWYGRDMTINGKTSKSDQLKIKYKDVWNKKIIPHNPIAHEQILEIQKNAKYAIIPSKWDMYNFTCLEYMSAGTVVICSDGAGVSELIDHGVNGYKYQAGDVKALASCIEKIASLNEIEYNQIIKNARNTLNTVLSTPKIIDTNIKCYDCVNNAFSESSSTVFMDAMFRPSELDFNIKQILDLQPFKLLYSYLLSRLKNKFNF